MLAIIIPGHPAVIFDDCELFGVILRTNFGLSIHSLCLDLAGHSSYVTVVTVSYMGLRHVSVVVHPRLCLLRPGYHTK